MDSPATLIRHARRQAGLSQASLASQVGMPQSVVARLERSSSNPTWDTLARVLSATGHELQLRKRRPTGGSIDETLVAENLRLTPGERLQAFERSYASVREFALAAARSRGDLA
jgi:transcriptional regulator with XRE-family HTH domain